MKKLLIQPCVLMVASLGLLLTACGGDEQAGGVTVIGEPTVSIEFVGTPGVSDVTVKFVPTEETAKFNYAIGSEQDRENFENGDIVGMQTETSNQEITHTWKDLEAGEYYVVYAMAYDEDGAAGPVSAHGFKTASSDFLVEAYYVGDNSAAFRITNTNDYYTYKFALGTADDKEAFMNDELEAITTKSEVFDWAENYFDLIPDTEYVFYCQGQDRSGSNTQLFEIPITTYSEGSDEIPNFVFEEGPKDFYMQEYTVTPNALCKQLVLYQQPEGASDGTMFGVNNWKGLLLDMFDSWKDIENIGSVAYGACITTAVNEELKAQMTTVDLELENPLDVYVTAYDEMYNPYLVKKFKNTTPAFNSSAALPDASDFTITTSNVTAEGLDISISYTSDNTRAFFYDLVSGNYWENEIKGDMEALKNKMITDYLNLAWCYNPAGKAIENNYVFSEDEQKTDAVPGATLYVGVLAMNENGPIEGGWADAVALSEPFTIPVE